MPILALTAGGSLPHKMPGSLIFALGLLACSIFMFSLYLENHHLDFLQRHPIIVNLLSGMIGFPVVTLVVGVGFSWYSRKRHLALNAPKIRNALDRMAGRTLELVDSCKSQYSVASILQDAERDFRKNRIAFARHRWEGRRWSDDDVNLLAVRVRELVSATVGELGPIVNIESDADYQFQINILDKNLDYLDYLDKVISQPLNTHAVTNVLDGLINLVKCLSDHPEIRTALKRTRRIFPEIEPFST